MILIKILIIMIVIMRLPYAIIPIAIYYMYRWLLKNK